MSEEIPQSGRRRRRPWLAPIWLVPIIAAAMIGAYLHRRYSEEGPTIQIEFREGQGLQAAKTDLRYRGVKLGEVRQLKLSDDMNSVLAEVQLVESAEKLACEGSKFWIVRPRVSLTGVQGLGTLVSGAYIEVDPGNGARTDHFVGLKEPPLLGEEERGLEIELVSNREGALEEDTPVFYRGVQVGAVESSGLSKDARQVISRIAIRRRYRRLVRAGSRFWNAGGVSFKFSLLHGAQMSAKSFATLIKGGVAFATPDPPGREARDGQHFALEEKPDPAWLKWDPPIEIEGPEGLNPQETEKTEDASG